MIMSRQALSIALLLFAITGCELVDGTSEDPEASAQPVIATYRNQMLDLSSDWADAQICVEVSGSDVRCYGNDAEYRADARSSYDPAAGDRAYGDCGPGWACLWQDNNALGRRLQWRDRGTKYLNDWGFRDKASTVWNRAYWRVRLANQRTLQPDEFRYIPEGAGGNLDTVGFNDKADKLVIDPF